MVAKTLNIIILLKVKKSRHCYDVQSIGVNGERSYRIFDGQIRCRRRSTINSLEHMCSLGNYVFAQFQTENIYVYIHICFLFIMVIPRFASSVA